MELYYGIMFLIVAFFQEHVEGVVVSVACSIVGFANIIIVDYIVGTGVSYYTAVMYLDIGLLIVAVNALSTPTGRLAFIAAGLSILLNVFYGNYYSEINRDIYELIKPYYTTINIIIFEVLLYACLFHSKFIPWAKDKYNSKAVPFIISKLPEKYHYLFIREKEHVDINNRTDN